MDNLNLKFAKRVITDYDLSRQESPQAQTKDGYLTKIVKYIPGDIVAAFLFAMNLIGEINLKAAATQEGLSGEQKLQTLWVVFFFLLVLTPWIRWRMIRIKGQGPDRSAIVQAFIAAIAFAAWVYALGGPFKFTTNWNPTWAGLILMGATLILPLLDDVLIPGKDPAATT